MTLDLFGKMIAITAEFYALLLAAWFVLLMLTGLYFDGAFEHEQEQ